MGMKTLPATKGPGLQSETKRLSAVCHHFQRPLVPGVLLRRYQRFLADVRLADGSEVVVHCPNSGSMLGCLEKEAPVFCSPSDNPKRRTAFTWEMIKINGNWVGINTLIPNHLIELAAREEALPLFRQVLEVKREVPLTPGTRIDLVVQRQRGPVVVEVKNVTLVRGSQARFPDAVTARGTKHVRELTRLRREGTDTAMVFVVQRTDADSFAPAMDIDPTYAAALEEARQVGVETIALRARVSPRSVCLDRVLPVHL